MCMYPQSGIRRLESGIDVLYVRSDFKMIVDRGSWIVDRESGIVDRGSWIVDRRSWMGGSWTSRFHETVMTTIPQVQGISSIFAHSS